MGIVLAFKEKDVRGLVPRESEEGDESVEWDLELSGDPTEPESDFGDALGDDMDGLPGIGPASGFGAGDD